MGQVDGKICIVTGGAGSIGLATVRLLLQEGAKVALVDIDEGKLGRAVAGLDPDQVITIAADVAKTDQVKAYVDRTEGRRSIQQCRQ
jgi:NAD(P)-dependent dehydrogenase (short-subunit alcohol dehydrogenase family)